MSGMAAQRPRSSAAVLPFQEKRFLVERQEGGGRVERKRGRRGERKMGRGGGGGLYLEHHGSPLLDGVLGAPEAEVCGPVCDAEDEGGGTPGRMVPHVAARLAGDPAKEEPELAKGPPQGAPLLPWLLLLMLLLVAWGGGKAFRVLRRRVAGSRALQGEEKTRG